MDGFDLYERRSFAAPARLATSEAPTGDELVEDALAQWIEVDGRARVLVDDALRVCWMSPVAERLTGGEGYIVIRNGHVRTRENRFERELRELVEGASSQMSSCCLHNPKSDERLILTALRLAAPHDDLVGLTLQRASEDFAFRLADLHSAFGLTQTERRVAFHLMSGRTAEETAHDLGVSLETVRTHIKRAYAKLGVSSREAFFHRLTPFVIVLS